MSFPTWNWFTEDLGVPANAWSANRAPPARDPAAALRAAPALEAARMGQTPGMGAAGAARGGNWLDGAGRIMDGLGNLGRIYAAIQGVKLGKQQLNFARQAFNTNTGNQTQTYNTSLEDRIRARYNTEGRSGEADGYLNQHRLTHRPL
jgi:hypothetical protein